MSSLEFDFDFDTQIYRLESEWRCAYDACISARAAYYSLAENANSSAASLDDARESVDRSEALKAKVMIKIERLEARVNRRI